MTLNWMFVCLFYHGLMWWTGKPGVQSMGLERVWQDWATEMICMYLGLPDCWVLNNWCFWTVACWATRRSNQLILKEISPGYSLEGLMLKVKLQYFGHLIWRTDSLEKTLMLGKIEGRRRRGWQRVRWLYSITDSMDMSLSKLQELAMGGWSGMLQSMGLQRVGHNWATELNWTFI